MNLISESRIPGWGRGSLINIFNNISSKRGKLYQVQHVKTTAPRYPSYTLFFSSYFLRNFLDGQQEKKPRTVWRTTFFKCTWVRFCKRLRSPGIDSEESIPVAWASKTNGVVVPVRQAENRFLGSLKGLQIRAQYTTRELFNQKRRTMNAPFT
jgi:hypothetical protein